VSLQCVKTNSEAVKFLLDFIDYTDPVYLVDVGASGGIEEHWSAFGTKLRSDGFDPLVIEVARLNSEAPEGVTYLDAYIDGGSLRRSVESPHPEDVRLTAFDRTTASEYGRIKNQDYRKEVFNRGEELRFSSKRFSLDEFIQAHKRPTPNFLKIDTDGSDFSVLQGATQILSDLNCFGVQVECQFHGRPDSQGNTFGNIDILMRSHGFRLFHLESWKYSRAEFPSPFVYEIAGQTVEGGIQWGEALYLRDPETNTHFRSYIRRRSEMVFKYLAIVVTMGQYDLAASLIMGISKNDLLEDTPLWMECLDLLTREVYPSMSGHDELIQKFKSNPDAFMPSSGIVKVSKGRQKSRWYR